jgi:antitoxin (DNA-binding transcriptional repressor) of toxin-antitoxin stability system
MNNVSVEDFCAAPGETLARVEAGEEIVVTRNGMPLTLLRPAGPADLEAALDRYRATQFGAVVSRMQAQALANGLDTMSDAAIEAEIAAVRSARRQR